VKKKEFKIDEVFLCGLIKLKCIKGNSCNGCYFKHTICQYEILGPCGAAGRSDKTNVVFIKVDK
jgi:hypothetical protein